MYPTKDQIAKAITGIHPETPPLEIFTRQSYFFDEFFKGYSKAEDRQEYAGAHMRFLERGVLRIKSLQFSALELVAMWGNLFKEMDKHIPMSQAGYIGDPTTRYPGYELAQYLVHGFASQDLPFSQRRDIKKTMESMTLDGLFKTPDEIDAYASRIGQIRQMKDEIRGYATLFPKDSFEQQFLHNVAENIATAYSALNIRLSIAREPIISKGVE